MNKTLFTIVVILFITFATALSQIRSVPSPAYPTIQAGIDAAVDGDTVIISPGTYTGTGNRDIDFKGKKITVRSTDPNDPNTVADTIIDCDGTETEPHRGFYFHSGETANSVLSGLTIINGFAQYGGGIYCDNSSPVIANCIIASNSAKASGAGIHCISSDSIITNCTIKNNASKGWESSRPWSCGGGIACEDSNVVITNCVITANLAFDPVYKVAGRGGGIDLFDSTATITDTFITGNLTIPLEADSSWWAPSGGGGGICFFQGNKGKLSIARCTINTNTGSKGGGIASFGDLNINNCIIQNNLAKMHLMVGAAGGIFCRGSLEVINSVVNNNLALGYGEPIAGGICCDRGTITIKNCIIWGNFPGQLPWQWQVYSPLPDNSVTYCDVQDGWPGAGNIDADPLLEWNGHLRAGSPCINAGDPNYTPLPAETDVDGESRIMGARIDIGADELLDSDSDGLADWWEVKYFGSPTIANPADDSDGDGWTNLDEYKNLTPPDIRPDRYYVNGLSGSDTYDGLAPEWDGQHGPKKTIQAGINACADMQNDIVTLAQGTYTGDGNRDIEFHGKTIAVRSTNPKDPNIVAATIIDCNGSQSAPHRAFYLHACEGPGSAISGLTITNGYAKIIDKFEDSPHVPIGGGILCYFSAPTISDCVISNCIASQGGGIYSRGNSRLSNCSISNCTASYDGSGGGVYVYKTSNITIADCTIFNNSSRKVGGIHCDTSCGLTITGCAIFNNSKYGIYGWQNTRLKISNCTIFNNSGCGVCGSLANSLTIRGCIIYNNSSLDHSWGEIRYSGNCSPTGYPENTSSLTITDCAIFNNAGSSGGGIRCYNCDLKLANCNITGNSAGNLGGGVYSCDSKGVITNCTFAGNSAPYGNALACDSYVKNKSLSNIRITNSILWDGGSEIWNNDGSTINVTYSDVQDPWPGTGNINADPCFVQPGYWDPNGTPADSNDDFWVGGDYYLLAGSPCINTGDPNYTPEPNETDLDGRPRIIAGRVDMGAYEFNHIPVADAGPDQTLSAGRNCIAEVTLDGSASYDEDDDELTFLWTWKIDAQTYEANSVSPAIELPLGQDAIQLIVSDGIDDSKPNEVIITVLDTTPPEFTLSVTPATLWPPNRQMIKVAPTWTLADNCDPSPEVSLANITCNENFIKGNGRTTGDIQVRNDGSIYLRAERSGTGSSRVYTITYQAADASGNTATSSATVTVPHDQGRLK